MKILNKSTNIKTHNKSTHIKIFYKSNTWAPGPRARGPGARALRPSCASRQSAAQARVLRALGPWGPGPGRVGRAAVRGPGLGLGPGPWGPCLDNYLDMLDGWICSR